MTMDADYRSALAALVTSAPDPDFVRSAALEYDSDPASMIEECTRCYREALAVARALLAQEPAPETATEERAEGRRAGLAEAVNEIDALEKAYSVAGAVSRREGHLRDADRYEWQAVAVSRAAARVLALPMTSRPQGDSDGGGR